MDPMHAAIKKRKGGLIDHGSSGQDEVMPANSGHKPEVKDLHGLVASLNDHEKHQLKSILSNQDNSQSIAKGGPSSDEKGKIGAAMNAENMENAAEEASETPHEEAMEGSDEIAKSMLDSRHMGSNPPTGKPRNLGERMKMNLASKLKAKGKM